MPSKKRKPLVWTLRKVSTRISLSMPQRLNRTDTFRLLWIFCFRNHYSLPLSPLGGNVSARISLVDTLCRVHNVDFLVERFI